MSAPWVAYIVVGLAISMIAVLGIGLMSLSRKHSNAKIPNLGTKKDA